MEENEKIREAPEETQNVEGLIVPLDKFLQSGMHIGTKLKTGDTKPYIYRRRTDQIYVMDIKQINERVIEAVNKLKSYRPSQILVVASRTYSGNAAKKFAEHIEGIEVITKRFVPGTMTNPNLPNFKEPNIILVCDPRAEREAIREAKMLNIPVVSLVDTDNSAKNIDLVVPMNNKGRKSLALFFWVLTREMMLSTGKIKNYDEFKTPISAFERLELEGE